MFSFDPYRYGTYNINNTCFTNILFLSFSQCNFHRRKWNCAFSILFGFYPLFLWTVKCIKMIVLEFDWKMRTGSSQMNMCINRLYDATLYTHMHTHKTWIATNKPVFIQKKIAFYFIPLCSGRRTDALTAPV